MFSYYGPGAGRNLSYFIDANELDNFKKYLEFAVPLFELHTNSSSRQQVWLGETSSTYNGGTAVISSSYAAGFMYETHFPYL